MSSTESGTPVGLVLSDDLLFASQITGHARALGAEVRVAKSVSQLLTLRQQHSVSCVILDLEHSELNLEQLIADLKECGGPLPRLVGYGSHVNVACLKAAREAGCDPVLPNSAFVEALPVQLSNWLNG